MKAQEVKEYLSGPAEQLLISIAKSMLRQSCLLSNLFSMTLPGHPCSHAQISSRSSNTYLLLPADICYCSSVCLDLTSLPTLISHSRSPSFSGVPSSSSCPSPPILTSHTQIMCWNWTSSRAGTCQVLHSPQVPEAAPDKTGCWYLLNKSTKRWTGGTWPERISLPLFPCPSNPCSLIAIREKEFPFSRSNHPNASAQNDCKCNALN